VTRLNLFGLINSFLLNIFALLKSKRFKKKKKIKVDSDNLFKLHVNPLEILVQVHFGSNETDQGKNKIILIKRRRKIALEYRN